MQITFIILANLEVTLSDLEDFLLTVTTTIIATIIITVTAIIIITIAFIIFIKLNFPAMFGVILAFLIQYI